MAQWQLQWSDRAAADLQSIWEYVAADDRAAADRLILELSEVFQLTSGYPYLGHPVFYLGDDYRSLTRNPYVLFYRIEEEADVVRLMRVVHGARNLPALFEGGD